jgi:phosphatidylinositol-3-phosphatase
MPRWCPVVCAFAVLTACGPGSSAARPAQTPIANVQATASPTPSAAPSPSPSPPPSHVFVIVMENRSYSQAIAGPYEAALANQFAVATNYHGVSHPSLPNYLAMTSGTTWGIADDGFHALPAGGLGAELSGAGVTWRAYMEGMGGGGCFHSGYPYALKHNPFAYYGSACPPQVVPFTQFATDMKGDVPRFVWITPGLCHDGHDCSTAVAEAWLKETIPTILSTSAWQQGGVLFVTYDEGEDSANSVLTLVIRPHPTSHASGVAYDHYSLLATIEDLLGVPRLGAARNASPMTDLALA